MHIRVVDASAGIYVSVDRQCGAGIMNATLSEPLESATILPEVVSDGSTTCVCCSMSKDTSIVGAEGV